MSSNDTTFYRYGYDNQRYLKFTTHTASGGGGGGGENCRKCYIEGGQANNTKGKKITTASVPSDTITFEERYPGQYHHVDVGHVAQD